MDVISFIEKDASRARGRSPWVRALAGGIAFSIPVGLGLGLREGYEGVLDPGVLVPNLLAASLVCAVTLGAFGAGAPSRRLLRLSCLGVLVGTFLAAERVFFPLGARTVYPSADVFWRESARCFTKGGVTTLTAGLWLTLGAFLISAWPSRRWRFLLSALAGTSGAVMLGFHCDSSSIGHVLAGHLSQGLVFGAWVFLLQEMLCWIGLRRQFPGLAAKVKNFRRLAG